MTTSETRVHLDDPVALQILWSRLVAIVDESATALQRTSFSTTVRESNDYACALLGPDATTLAENTLGVPSFAGVMSRVTRAFLDHFPLEGWRPGDIGLTNDPWLNTGHLPDTTILAPVFLGDDLVAFVANAAHKSDMGGAGYTALATEVYEEGLRLPICKLYERGEPNDAIIDIITANTRVPEIVMGDLSAQIAAAHVCQERLLEFLAEQQLRDLTPLGTGIQERAERAMRTALAALPDGTYSHAFDTDGFEEPLRIAVTLIVDGDALTIDFDGTSDQLNRGVNSVYNYTYALTCYTVKCVLDPDTPKNEGSYRPIEVKVPEGSVLNPRFPAAVNARSMSGHFVASAVLGALSQVLPDRVIADSGSCPGLRLHFSGIDRNGFPFGQMLFPNGGMGAGARRDGLDCTGFPTNAGGASVEVTEAVAPLIVWERTFLPDSGGPGIHRGGLGQRVDIEFVSDRPGVLRSQFDRMIFPAQGLFGGHPGGLSQIVLNGRQLPGKVQEPIQEGDRIVANYAGGGGFGPPRERDPAAVRRDLDDGLITPEAARDVYGLDHGAAK
jgi:N-methylhydantoinase B